MPKAPKKAKYDPSKRPKKVYSKGWATRRKNALMKSYEKKATAAGIPPLNQQTPRQDTANLEAPMTNMQGASGVGQVVSEQPGRGEIVGGLAAQLAEQFSVFARKKGGKDQIQKLIEMEIQRATLEGSMIGEKGARELSREYAQRLDDQIVCGFIAEVDISERQHDGRLPHDETWNIASITISKVAQALKRAGYSSSGKRR